MDRGGKRNEFFFPYVRNMYGKEDVKCIADLKYILENDGLRAKVALVIEELEKEKYQSAYLDECNMKYVVKRDNVVAENKFITLKAEVIKDMM